MNASRKSLVTRAFNKLDRTGDSLITVEDLKGVYNVKKHPKYLNGEWTEDQCLGQFLESFDSDDKDGQVSSTWALNYMQLTLIVSNSVDSNFRLSRILSKSQTSLCINIYNLTSDESKFRLSRIKVLVPKCRKPYYLHSLSRIYLSKHVYYLGIKIGSHVKHPVIDFDIFTLGYFTCLFHNLSN